MKRSKRLIVFMSFIAAVLLFLSWAYIGMNGYPWKIKQTEVAAQKYLKEKYPDLNYKIEKAYYNSKFGRYTCSVISEGDLAINFHITVISKDKIEDDYLKMKVDTEAKTMVVDLIKDSIPQIKNISVLEDAGADAVNESYEKYSSFIPGKAYPLKIDILWNGDEMSLDTFVDKVLNAREKLKSKNIEVCGLYVQDVKNGYVISLNGRVVNGKTEGNYNASKDEIMKSSIAYKMK